MRKLSLVLSCTCLFLLQSCENYQDIRDIDRVDHEPEIAVPLFSSDLSVNDVLDEYGEIDFLHIHPDGSMSLNYAQEQVQKKFDELIPEMEDFPIILPDSFVSIPIQFMGNVQATRLGLKKGTIRFDIQSSHTEDIDVSISFPGIRKDGMSFSVQTNLAYQGNTPFSTAITPQDLQGYDLFLTNGQMEVRYEAYDNSGERVLLDMVSGMTEGWEFQDAEGILASESYDISIDTVTIDLFESWTEGQIDFEDPKLRIDLSNSIGFPVRLQVKNMTAHTLDGEAIPVSSVFSEGFDLKFPAINQIGQIETDQVVLDKTNSNIISIFNAQPESITYELVATINPEDNDIPGFISEESIVAGAVTVDIPIYGTASGFTFESNTDFDLEEVEEVSHVEIKLITDNSIPLDLDLQVYFTDVNDQIIDSLFDHQRALLTAPEIAANGMIMNTTEQTTLIEVTAERFEHFRQASQVKLKAAISTANNAQTPVKILDHQKVAVRMGAIIGFE